jgi:Cu(I)/Ag(I) efflux system periplasmic protein CusF
MYVDGEIDSAQSQEGLMKKLLILVLFAAFSGFAWLSLPGLDQAQLPGVARQAATGSGVVVAVDQEKGIVTISHGPLPALNMMAMTMGYLVRDSARIAGLRPMQTVEFQVVFDGNDYLITDIR